MRGLLQAWQEGPGWWGVLVPVPTLCFLLWPRHGSPVAVFPPVVSGEGTGWQGGGAVEVGLLALSLERARQFVKAFGKRGGDLHVT